MKVWKNSMRISDLHAAKEHRVTVGFDELPREVLALNHACAHAEY